MLTKRFFYVCAGLLCLALAYHFGARNATAQSTTPSVVAMAVDSCHGLIVITSKGDVFVRPNQVCADPFIGAPVFAGNFWQGR